MKLEKLTNLLDSRFLAAARMSILTALIAVVSLNVHAQCPLGCNNNVQISLNGSCEATITPDVILEGMGTCDDEDYRVTIELPNGTFLTSDLTTTPLTHPTIGAAHIGMTLKVRVNDLTSSNGNNSCWGYISVEDKLAPVLSCGTNNITDVTVGCNDVVNITSSYFTHGVASVPAFTYAGDVIYVNGVSEPLTMSGGSSQSIMPGETACIKIDVNNLNQFDVVNSLAVNLNLLSSSYTVNVLDPSGNTVMSTVTATGDFTISNPSYIGQQAVNSLFDGEWQLCISSANQFQLRGVTGNSLSFTTRGFFFDQLNSADNCTAPLAIEILTDETVDIDCGDATYPNISAIRTITCMATDASGNESNICTKNIFYERKTLADIEWPAHYESECSVSTATTPSVTGRPTIDGVVIDPNNGYCEINLTYNENMIDVCGVSFKLLRNWIALDWCASTSTTHTQIIKISDTEGPSIQCGDSYFDIDVNPYTCTADFTVPYPDIDSNPLNDVIKFDCSETSYRIKWSMASIPADGICNNSTATSASNYVDTGVSYDGNASNLDADGFASSGTFTISGLPAGCIWIYFEVKDECGNITTCTKDIKVVDNTPPTPVCDQNTVVTLNTSAWAHIFAETFDDGSFDNCDNSVSFGVRRMSDPCGQFTGNTAGSNPTQVFMFGGNRYYDFVKFCCTDVDGDDVMVELVVWDASGNANVCMVNVRVDNKVTPTISCLLNNSNTNNSLKQTVNIDCSAAIPSAPTVAQVMSVANDNCDNVETQFVSETSSNPNTCGLYTITRTWRAYNKNTNATLHTCIQTINIVNSVPFVMDATTAGGQIKWPADKTFEGCMNVDTDPDNPTGPGVPTFTGDVACSQLAYTYADQVFNFVEDACFKVLRTWTVIDWCQYNPSTPFGAGFKQYTQIIKINNNSAPVFASCSTRSICTYENTCQGEIELITSATDDCTPANQIVYSYVITVANGGGTINGTSNDASGVYPVGSHSIMWTAEDQCGNISTCTQTFIVRDCKNPTPYCISGITTVVMPTTGEIEIWASDFDLGSYDNCTSQNNLRFSFSPSTSNTNMTFTCDDLGSSMVTIYVTDAAGNQDFCETMIEIQNTGGCEDMPRPMVSGRVTTETGITVDNVDVMMEETISLDQSMMTTVGDGLYEFMNANFGNDYNVSADRNDDHMNGVSTLDLVLIQKHILGITSLDSPYKVIAADINNSASVSASDLVELRKLILGIYDELPNNDSWRFVDATQAFAVNNQPWPLNEKINIAQIQNNDMDNDFKAVKVGDVNGNAIANAQGGNIAENRSSESLNMAIADQAFLRGDLVRVEFTSEDFEDILGMQYTLSFDENSLEFIGVDADLLSVSNQNVNASRANEGMISFSWSEYKGSTVESGDVLYTMTFRARTNNDLTNTIYGLSSVITQTEAYNTDLQVINLNLSVGNQFEDTAFGLGQNTPNPFSTETQISFTLPESMIAQLSIYDVAGRKITTISNTFDKGQNVVNINNTLLEGATGVLYYRLEAGEYTATKKMIIIQ